MQGGEVLVNGCLPSASVELDDNDNWKIMTLYPQIKLVIADVL